MGEASERDESASMAILAFPAEGRNPYCGLLTDAVEGTGEATVTGYRSGRSWRERPDVFHVHWPDNTLESTDPVRAAARAVLLVAETAWHRRRGAAVVWTAHNRQSHEGHHPPLEAWLWRGFGRLVDGVIHLHPPEAPDPRLRPDVVETVSRIGRYPRRGEPDRAGRRRALGVDDDTVLVGLLGEVRAYKGFAAFAERFRAEAPDSCRLLVAGRPRSDELADELVAVAALDDRVDLDLRWLDDDELDELAAACDVVVLPYERLGNSAVAVLALGHGRRVLAGDSPSMRALRAEVGGAWVELLGERPLAEQLLDGSPPGAPDLSTFEWPAIGRETVAFHRRVRAHRDGTSGAATASASTSTTAGSAATRSASSGES